MEKLDTYNGLKTPNIDVEINEEKIKIKENQE